MKNVETITLENTKHKPKEIFGIITLVSTTGAFLVFIATLYFGPKIAQIISLSMTIGFAIGLILDRLKLKIATQIYMTTVPPTMFGITIILAGGYFGQGVGIATSIFLSFIVFRKKQNFRKLIISYDILMFLIPTIYINLYGPILGVVDFKYDEIIVFIASLAWLSVTFFMYDERKTRNYTNNLEEKNNSLKLNEEKLSKAQLNLKSQNSTLYNLNIELNARNKQIEDFTNIVTHDLKAPLDNINIITEELKKYIESGNLKESLTYLKHLETSSIKMTQLVTGLVEYNKIGDSKNLTEIDCQKLIGEILDEKSEQIVNLKAQIKMGTLPVIIGNENELKIMFYNLIDNALKFVPSNRNPKVLINSEKKTGYYLFQIRDNGIGIPEEEKANIFDAFSKLHHQKDFKGSGIGLFGVKRVVNQHKGRIWVESVENKGSTFSFTISSKLKANTK